MSERSGGSGGVIVAVGIIVVIVIVVVFSRSGEPPLERTATGSGGLVSWLKSNDVDARIFAGGRPLVRDTVALRILPVYDTDLWQLRVPP